MFLLSFPAKSAVALDKFIDEAVFVASGAFNITRHKTFPVASSWIQEL